MIDLDIWRTARLVIQRYGAGARAHAAKRTETLATAGDEQGAAVWKAILRAIDWLECPEGSPAPGQRVNRQ